MIRSIEEHLHNPPPGIAAARAHEFGIDLTLLIQRLKRTPVERLNDLQSVMRPLEEARKNAGPDLRQVRD